jgi:hypothetical protein
MLIVDCALRYAGIKLHFPNTLRGAIFVYGSSTIWLLDHKDPGLTHIKWIFKYILYDYFELTYFAYWQSGFLNVFRHFVNVDGVPYGFNYVNILTIEILLWFLVKCGEMGSLLVHCQVSLPPVLWIPFRILGTELHQTTLRPS